MKFSQTVQAALSDAIVYAKKKRYELVTPEMLLMQFCRVPLFQKALGLLGADSEALEKNLEAFLRENLEEAFEGARPELSSQLSNCIAFANMQILGSGREEIDLEHMVQAIFQQRDSYAVYYLHLQHVDEVDLLGAIMSVKDEEVREAGEAGTEERHVGTRPGTKGTPLYEQYAPCLNDTLKDINPLIGRANEMERLIQVLCRLDKNNPLLIGESGVGKTAIAYGLVEKIRKGDVPEAIRGSRVFSLDLGAMLAGTQYRGDFEKRLKGVLDEIGREEKPIILIDEIHNLAGAGAVGESSFDASNLLKPYLAGGRIRFIGATTFDEYKRHFEKNKSLARRFQQIEVPEPTEEEAVRILEGLKGRYEAFHHVTYLDGTMQYAVSMSREHIHERYLPDKAIDLMDEAGAYRKLHPIEGKQQTVDREVFADVLTRICRVPLESVQADELEGLETLDARLKNQVFGQDAAIQEVVNAIKFSRAGLLEDDKPLASLLFVGPTGVGKTEVARVLAKELGVELVRFDMSEYGEKHTVAKLIGSPAGYVGYEDGGLLTESIRKHPSCVLLLDEIEKAHPDIYHVLLQVMDYATLTDNQGRKADFRHVVLIMTSNAGAERIGKPGIGFASIARVDRALLMEEVNRTFQPEFRNRLNRIVAFSSMDGDMAKRIVEKKLHELAEMLRKKGIRLSVTESAKALILSRGVSLTYGAREVDRVIRSEVKPRMVDEILFGSLRQGGNMTLDASGEEFSVSAGT